MNQSTIQAQIDVINKATSIAIQSKEAAKKFLIDAGILKDENKSIQSQSSIKVKK